MGLSNIQEIKQKYSNIYVQYRKEEDMFSVQFILVFEQSDYHITDYLLRVFENNILEFSWHKNLLTQLQEDKKGAILPVLVK